MEKGYVQVYTGNGKGKTTAALGLSLRAVCSGKKVFFGQFMKGMTYSELKATAFLPNFTLEQFGGDCFVYGKPTEKDIEDALKGFEEMKAIIFSNQYDVVVLDELNTALFFELIPVSEVVDLIKSKPEQIELIITGRYAKSEIIEVSDLVTEMKEIKHYYEKGVEARVGIEN